MKFYWKHGPRDVRHRNDFSFIRVFFFNSSPHPWSIWWYLRDFVSFSVASSHIFGCFDFWLGQNSASVHTEDVPAMCTHNTCTLLYTLLQGLFEFWNNAGKDGTGPRDQDAAFSSATESDHQRSSGSLLRVRRESRKVNEFFGESWPTVLPLFAFFCWRTFLMVIPAGIWYISTYTHIYQKQWSSSN
jgi:hypothetical protein